jgi:formamidopyrimidine-DNA glycosylase
MPELPEVETVRLGLQPVMEGATIEKVELRRGDLRAPFPKDFARRLHGRKVEALRRRAKYLLAELDDGEVLVLHLGMSGSFRVDGVDRPKMPGVYYHERTRLEAHDHVVFHLKGGARVIYNDPRRFGVMDLIARRDLDSSPRFEGMGLEPLGNAFGAEELAARLAGKAAPLKAALLDQRVVAGLGNIYVCEALWQARLSPKRKAGTIVKKGGKPDARCRELASAIRKVLNEAVAAGGSSLRDHARIDGTLGMFQHNFRVYDREGHPCPRKDEGMVKRITQSGRSTFFCPACQK